MVDRTCSVYFAVFTALCWSCPSLQAQNLIPNSGFEELDQSCVGSATYSILADWVRADCAVGGTYLNECSTLNGVPSSGTPANSIGYQVPMDGVAYAALWTYNRVSSFARTYYLSVPLTEPLVSGTEYCFSAHLALAERSAYRTTDLHVVLTEEFPSTCDGNDTLSWLPNAQLILNTTEVDTTSWAELSGSFIANGGEAYITIGDLNTQSAPDTVYIGPTTFPVQRAMYYVDMVELRSCESSVVESGSGELVITFDPGLRAITLHSRENDPVGRVVVLDMAGRVVLTDLGNRTFVQLTAVDLPRGIYVVQAEINGSLLSRRVAIH